MRFKLAPQEQCVLRQARKDDSRHVAELIVIAGDQRPEFPYAHQQAVNGEPIDLAKPRAARVNETFAFRHAVMAIFNGRVAGMVLGYRLSFSCEALKPDRLAQYLRPLMLMEAAQLGGYYINTLAIYPDYQSHGLGARLLEKAQQKALRANCRSLSLEVCEQNTAAMRFYERHGFEVAGRRLGEAKCAEPYDKDIAFLWRPVNR